METWTPSIPKKKGSLQSERDYQKLAIRQWEDQGGWAQNIHPSQGMKTGIPDTIFLLGKHLIPIEFKVGHIEGDYLKVKDIRPAQRRWALNYRDSGGLSSILVGVQYGFFALSVDQFCSGRQKFNVEELRHYTGAKEAVRSLERQI